MKPRIVVTQSPYSSFLRQACLFDEFAGLRLNTVMPVESGARTERLLAMQDACRDTPLWVDLKARQLRVVGFANVPYTSVRINQRIRCDLPTVVYFDNGRECATVVAIDEFELILEGPLGRLLGPGESVNLPGSSLQYVDDELFTPGDKDWIEAAESVGIHHYMLSFVESSRDVERLRALDPKAIVMAKIESRKGLKNMSEIAGVADSLLAARGDLFVEVAPPHEVDAAVHRVLEVGGPQTMVGSRILESLMRDRVPSLSDLADLHRLRDWGVTSLMLGDDLCFHFDGLSRAIRIIHEIWQWQGPSTRRPHLEYAVGATRPRHEG